MQHSDITPASATIHNRGEPNGARSSDLLALADWRRRIATLYAEVRSMADPKLAWFHWISVRSDLYRSHPMSPVPAEARDTFSGIPVFDYDPSFRFEVGLNSVSGESETVDLGSDGMLSRRPVARTSGLRDVLGGELVVWWIEGYGGGLFLPFAYRSSGSETYGGGRYLIDAIKGADPGSPQDGRIVLDFNFAYHPSCALNGDYVCPLAPGENRLPGSVHAGERLVELDGGLS